MHTWELGGSYKHYKEDNFLLSLMRIETHFLAIPPRVLLTIRTESFLLHGLLIMRINWSSECYAKLLCVLNFTLICQVGLLAELAERELSH